MTASRKIYPTLAAYYADDRRRVRSGEADYGCHWRLHGWGHKWRVSYVHLTAEIYAVCQGVRHDLRGSPHNYGPLFVLGVIPPDHYDESPYRRDVYYATLDRYLDGWAFWCGAPNGLLWLRDRIANVERELATERSAAAGEEANPQPRYQQNGGGL